MRDPFAFKITGGKEFKAADKLLRYGVIAMNPCFYIRRRQNKDGIAVLDADPVLKGYFVGLFPFASIAACRNARFEDGTHVLGAPLSASGVVSPLDWRTFDEIRELNSYSEEAPEIPKQRGLHPGMTVILKGGIHAGKRFRLDSVSKNGQKARGVLQMLGSLREVEVTPETVRIVEAA